MPIKAVENRRLYRQIAAQLSALIASGEFAVGQRLPPERELALQLGVSRPSLREAVIALELEGMVEVRIGSGIWVTSASLRGDRAATPLPDVDGEGPFELLHARALIEGEIAAVAARDATPDDLAAIRGALDAMEQLDRQGNDPDPADRDFHLRIAASTGNSVLHAMVEDLWDRGRGAMWRKMAHHFDTPELRAATLADHRAILAALESHNPSAARHALRAHLRRVDAEFARGWQRQTARPQVRPRRARPGTPAAALKLKVEANR